MGFASAIEWCDATFNWWWGCRRRVTALGDVDPACVTCYAAVGAKRYGFPKLWSGDHRFLSDAYWKQPLAWNRQAEAEGRRLRVFCGSYCDVFERVAPEHPDHDRMEATRRAGFELIEATPSLDWLLLTKRPENAIELVPESWGDRDAEGRSLWPRNAWLGFSASRQSELEERWPYAATLPAPVRFLSAEPLLEELALRAWCPSCRKLLLGSNSPTCGSCHDRTVRLDWVIGGGMSGAGADPTHPAWARSLRDQAKLHPGTAFHWKQWGQWGAGSKPPGSKGHERVMLTDGTLYLPAQVARRALEERHLEGGCWRPGLDPSCVTRYRSKRESGRELDGRAWDEFPEAAA